LRTPRGCSRSGTVADGYWNDLTKGACPGKLTDEWDGLLDTVLEVFEAAIERLGLGMSLIGLDGFIRERVEAAFVSGTTSW
jgi:Xaa-Pro aminopeptidase